MNASDTLIAIAQVAVTLAGFSGIVVVLGRRSLGEFSAADRLDLGALLRPSLGVALWALIPLVLDSAGIAERLVWRVSSAAYFAYICGVVFGFAFPQAREAGALRRASRWLSWASLAGQVLLLLGNAAGPSQAWPYLTALLIALLVSALAFARLLMSTR